MAFRRIIFNSEQRDSINQDVEKYINSDFYKTNYKDLKTTIKNGVKPEVLVVDINGEGADSVAKKLKMVGAKYNAKVTIKNEIPLDKLKEVIKEAIRTEIKINDPHRFRKYKQLVIDYFKVSSQEDPLNKEAFDDIIENVKYAGSEQEIEKIVYRDFFFGDDAEGLRDWKEEIETIYQNRETANKNLK